MQNNSVIKSLTNPISVFVKKNYGPLIGFLSIAIILSITSSVFLKPDNLINVLRQVSINGLVAAGVTCVIMIGCIDLSVGSTVAVAGCLSVTLNTVLGVNFILAALMGIFAGAFFGFTNGFIRAKTMLPPFIITLAMQQTLRGFAYIFTAGYPVTSVDERFNAIGNGYLGPIPIPVVIMFVIYIMSVAIWKQLATRVSATSELLPLLMRSVAHWRPLPESY
jgi:ribose transport system permease protein